MNAVNRAMGITLLQCGHLRDIFPTMPKLLSYVNTKIEPEPFSGQERVFVWENQEGPNGSVDLVKGVEGDQQNDMEGGGTIH